MGKVYELLKKFEDGENRYIDDPIFRDVIDSLIAGGDIYKLIDLLLQLNSLQKNTLNLCEDILSSKREKDA